MTIDENWGKPKNTKELIEWLAGYAYWDFHAYGSLRPKRSAYDYIREGKEVPDYCLPGRFIMGRPQKEREMLKDLKSDDANGPNAYHRVSLFDRETEIQRIFKVLTKPDFQKIQFHKKWG